MGLQSYRHLAAINELVDELHARSDKEYISPFNMALVAACMGDMDLAVKYLETAFEEREPILLTILTWPNVPDNLKNDPRCRQLIRKIGFPE